MNRINGSIFKIRIPNCHRSLSNKRYSRVHLHLICIDSSKYIHFVLVLNEKYCKCLIRLKTFLAQVRFLWRFLSMILTHLGIFHLEMNVEGFWINQRENVKKKIIWTTITSMNDLYSTFRDNIRQNRCS